MNKGEPRRNPRGDPPVTVTGGDSRVELAEGLRRRGDGHRRGCQDPLPAVELAALRGHLPWEKKGGGGFRVTMELDRPTFPITVEYENEPAEIFESEEDLCCNLEWFNSEDPEEQAKVVDSRGRSVELRIKELEIRKFIVKGESESPEPG